MNMLLARSVPLGWLCLWAAVMGIALPVMAAEVMPPAPPRYFNDYANATRPPTRDQLNRTLEQFEKDTSSQIIVAVFPKMQSDSSIEDYTQRVAESWRVGQKAKNNGAVLFVFINDRKMFIQVGYGLEGPIPDAIAKRIVADEITPRFRSGDFDAGLSAGVNALMSAARGEYKGTGRTAAQGGNKPRLPIIVIFILIIIVFSVLGSFRRATSFGRRGRSGWVAPIIFGGGGGGGWSGGGGGGGFSGGGGSFGGGGAGGSW